MANDIRMTELAKPSGSAARQAALSLAVSLALALSALSGRLLGPLLDVEPITRIAYLRSALISATGVLVFVSLVCIAGWRSPGAIISVTGVTAPLGRPVVFGILALAPAVVVSLALAPFAQGITWPDVAWKVLAGPFLEEFAFRGLAVGVLMRLCRWPMLAACLWPSIFFGGAHALQGSDLGEIAGIVGVTAAGGLLFGWLFVRWGFNLWPAFLLHAGLNGLWLFFDLGENAIGGWLGNALRLGVVAISIGLTFWLAPGKQGSAAAAAHSRPPPS